MKRADTLTAIGFLIFAAVMLALALTHLPDLQKDLRTAWSEQSPPPTQPTLLDKAAFSAQRSEDTLNQYLDPNHLFIQLYGGSQRLMGRRYVDDMVSGNSVVKLDTGALNFINLDWAITGAASDVTASVEATSELSQWLQTRGIPFLTVITPHKIARNDQLPVGLSDIGNPSADAFLEGLTRQGVENVDLRPAFDAREDRTELFFRTDHHWRPEGAFYAYQLLSEELSARYGFPANPQAADPESYEWSTLPGFFLGSQGKRVGSLYAGTDDFTVVTPKFDTSFTYETPYETRTGSFREALCFPQFIEEQDWFENNPYTYYAGGDYGQARMTNHNNPDGPKVLLIRESFSCALAPFFAMNCSRLTTVDMRHLDRPLREVVEEEDPDLVLMLYSASNTANAQLFSWSPLDA